MVTRVWAVWFVVSTVVPFTPPFATLDLTDVLGRTHKAVATVSTPDALLRADDSADDVASADPCGHRLLPTIRWTLLSVTSPNSDRVVPTTIAHVGASGSAPPALDVSPLIVTLRI
jgi:hypothetical protein